MKLIHQHFRQNSEQIMHIIYQLEVSNDVENSLFHISFIKCWLIPIMWMLCFKIEFNKILRKGKEFTLDSSSLGFIYAHPSSQVRSSLLSSSIPLIFLGYIQMLTFDRLAIQIQPLTMAASLICPYFSHLSCHRSTPLEERGLWPLFIAMNASQKWLHTLAKATKNI